MKNDPVQVALAKLDGASPRDIEKALSSKWNLVVAKAARMCTDVNLLHAAFFRMLANGPVLDKGCTAMLAIARTLVTLDDDNAELFRAGIKHVQMEPVWGGREDTAAELRAACATGLANTSDPRRMRDLAELLADPDWVARAGAAHAIGAVGSEAAAALLRFKIVSGDGYAEVISECYAGLFEIEGAELLPLIRRMAGSLKPDRSEPALLALGASRRPDAIEILKEIWQTSVEPARQRCILLALSSSRVDGALEFLREVERTSSPATSRMAREALAIHDR